MPAAISHPIFPRFYARFVQTSEQRGGAEHRQKLLAGLSGRVIELGAGSGANFSHYPPPSARSCGLRTACFQRRID
jgi:hypothetical protein